MTLKNDNKEKFVVKRDKKFGGDLKYDSYNQIEKDFIDKKLHPLDLKNAVADEINNLLEPIRKDKLINKLYKEAYS
ncbi:MAG: tyrosine--tRNA ligase, partial [Nanoarchaeota archaeon]|nr:tyrosine--tRNA ligase [Nanoarchaeota archaeon]